MTNRHVPCPVTGSGAAPDWRARAGFLSHHRWMESLKWRFGAPRRQVPRTDVLGMTNTGGPDPSNRVPHSNSGRASLLPQFGRILRPANNSVACPAIRTEPRRQTPKCRISDHKVEFSRITITGLLPWAGPILLWVRDHDRRCRHDGAAAVRADPFRGPFPAEWCEPRPAVARLPEQSLGVRVGEQDGQYEALRPVLRRPGQGSGETVRRVLCVHMAVAIDPPVDALFAR